MNSITAAEFAAARFAQHPDGRIAARITPEDEHPWRVQVDTLNWTWQTDAAMAEQGWRIVTPAPDLSDPDVIEQAAQRARDAYHAGHARPWEDAGNDFKDPWRAAARAALTLPPARDPEAEKLASALARALPASVAIHFDGDSLDATADALLAEGVRVGGGEDRACGRGPCCLEDGHDGECKL